MDHPQEDRTSLFLADLLTGATSLVAAASGSISAVLSDDLLVTAASADALTFTLEGRDLVTGETLYLAEGVGIGRPLVDRGRVVFAERIDSVTSTLWLAERDDTPAYDHYLDVLATDPYQQAILDFTGEGFVCGYATGTFRTFHPRHPLPWAQLAKILATSPGLPVDESLTPPTPFTDLGADDLTDLYPHEYGAAVAQAGRE